MQKFVSLLALAVLAIGCKGGDTGSTMTQEGGTTGAAAGGSGTYTLKLAPKEGDKFGYDMVTDMGMAKTEMGMTMTCTKVDGDKYTMTTTFDSMKMNGKDAPAAVFDSMKKMKVISVMDSHGKTLSTSLEGAPAGTPAPEAGTVSYPANAIKVGDTWEGTQKINGSEIKAKYKLVKVDNVNGMEAATIECTMEGLPAGATPDGPTVTVIELATGMPISVTTKMKVKGADGKDMSVGTEMKRR